LFPKTSPKKKIIAPIFLGVAMKVKRTDFVLDCVGGVRTTTTTPTAVIVYY
jgi:hypothetical protein